MSTIDHELSTDEIAERVAAYETGQRWADESHLHAGEGAADPPSAAPQRHYTYFRPLADAANEWVEFARHPERRIYLGIEEFDEAMRGLAPGELATIVGYTHSGKTVLLTQVIMANRLKRICLFTPDETRVAVLVKLAAIVHGVSAEELERRVGLHDPEAERMVRETATVHFPQLVVYDDVTSVPVMHEALAEAEDWWGDHCELAIFDYVDLLEDVEDTSSRFKALKAWGRQCDVPLIVVHQSSRSSGGDGAKVRIDSGAYGGESPSTFLLGVRRKALYHQAMVEELRTKIATSPKPQEWWGHELAEHEYELERHRNTITFSLVKNKRPPMRLVDDIDYELDPDTGQVRRYDPWLFDEF